MVSDILFFLSSRARAIKSQHGEVGRDFRDHLFQHLFQPPCLKQAQLEQVAHVQLGFEYLQGWTLLSRQPVLVLL